VQKASVEMDIFLEHLPAIEPSDHHVMATVQHPPDVQCRALSVSPVFAYLIIDLRQPQGPSIPHIETHTVGSDT